MQTHICSLHADHVEQLRWQTLIERENVRTVLHQQLPEQLDTDASQVWVVLGSSVQVLRFIGQLRAADSLVWVMAGLSDYSSQHACQCLDLGADCVAAPAWTDAEILAWWRRLCCRAGPVPVKSIDAGPLRVYSDEPVAYLHGHKLDLSHKQVKLLRLFAKNINVLIAREAIHDLLHTEGRPASEPLVDMHIYRIRRLLGGTTLSIETVRGEGYVLRMRAAHPIDPQLSSLRRGASHFDILRNLGGGPLTLHRSAMSGCP